MKVSQKILNDPVDYENELSAELSTSPGLILVFGSVQAISSGAQKLVKLFPDACIAGCSTAGEIYQGGVKDNTLIATFLSFEKATVTQFSTELSSMEDSFAAGQRLASGLPKEGLKAILVLGQGVGINGSALISGITDKAGLQIPITGGLAGDGGAFAQTWVLDRSGLSSSRVTCVGFYGDDLTFLHGSFGGWSPFGPARKVTRCKDNVLFELDGEPALAVYKRYLGDHAKDLPSSGLLFPFSMLSKDHSDVGLIRTILGVNESEGSLTLAGDIVPDGYLKLMHASTDALVDGAELAAMATKAENSEDGGFALLVSCVGRKLVMGFRTEEEVEAVGQVFGDKVALAGFYSYGEISPLKTVADCKLHNQTMTITYINEST